MAVEIYNLGTPTSLSELHKVIEMVVHTDMGWEILKKIKSTSNEKFLFGNVSSIFTAKP